VAGISKSETLNRLSEKTGLTKKQVGQFLDELAALAYKEARSGFTIPRPHWRDTWLGSQSLRP